MTPPPAPAIAPSFPEPKPVRTDLAAPRRDANSGFGRRGRGGPDHLRPAAAPPPPAKPATKATAASQSRRRRRSICRRSFPPNPRPASWWQDRHDRSRGRARRAGPTRRDIQARKAGQGQNAASGGRAQRRRRRLSRPRRLPAVGRSSSPRPGPRRKPKPSPPSSTRNTLPRSEAQRWASTRRPPRGRRSIACASPGFPRRRPPRSAPG